MVPMIGRCPWTTKLTFASAVPVWLVIVVFLGQNVDHHGSGMPKKHGEEPFHALKSRSEDEKTVPGKSIDTIFASSEDMP